MNKDYVEKLGKDIMNIVDDDKSNSIELDEFVKMFTDTDLKFRMNIVFWLITKKRIYDIVFNY